MEIYHQDIEYDAPIEERIAFFQANRQAELDRLKESFLRERRALFKVIQTIDTEDTKDSSDDCEDEDEEALTYEIFKEQFIEMFIEDEISQGIQKEEAQLKAKEEEILRQIELEYLEFLKATKNRNVHFDEELDLEAIERDALLDDTTSIIQEIALLGGTNMTGVETYHPTTYEIPTQTAIDLSAVEIACQDQPLPLKTDELKDQESCETRENSKDKPKKQKKNKGNVFRRFFRWLRKFSCAKTEQDD